MPHEIVKNLEKARRLTFDNFETIVLEPEAVEILVHLFIHPGCKSDINLATFVTGKSVLLSEISPHIITAFPSQVATFAKRKSVTRITGADLLECFALDHTDAVEENQHALEMEPSYALAHVLTVATVLTVKKVEQRQLANLEVTIAGSTMQFSHVLVPGAMQLHKGQTVFHHFGVIVAVADSKDLKKLARQLAGSQSNKAFLKKILKQVKGKDVKNIDYAKESFFKVDMTGKLIEQSDLDMNFQKLWAEEDLKNIKLPKEPAKGGSASGGSKEEKVMFSS